MAIFTVHTRSDDFKLIREGHSTFALLAPPIWLVVNRLWLELLAYVGLMVLFVLIAYQLQNGFAFLLTGLPGLFLWLEGNQLVRAKIERNGWQLSSVVEAGDFESAEAKHLAGGASSAIHRASHVSYEKVQHKPVQSSNPLVTNGLFPE